MPRTAFLTARRARRFDTIVVVWAVVWLLLGLYLAIDINNVGQLTNTVVRVTGGLKQVTDGLSLLKNIPLVGSGIGQAVDNIDTIVTKADSEAHGTHDSVTRISIFAGLTAALLPTLLLLAIYLPWRIPFMRSLRSIRAALAYDPDDARLDRYLAGLAVHDLTYDQLCVVSDDPWGDMAAGRCRALADAELARLGVARPAVGTKPAQQVQTA